MLICDDVPVTAGYGGHVVELSALSVFYPLRGVVYDYFHCDFYFLAEY